MRLRTSRIALILLFALASLLEASALAGQASRNQAQPPQPAQPAQPPQDTQQTQQTQQQTGQTNRARRGRAARGTRRNRAAAGVPTGVQNCIERLVELSANDSLAPYEGQPSQIINNGLLWSDEKSKCSIGTDNALRLKVLELSNAWRMKDSARVQSLLQEIKSQAPQT